MSMSSHFNEISEPFLPWTCGRVDFAAVMPLFCRVHTIFVFRGWNIYIYKNAQACRRLKGRFHHIAVSNVTDTKLSTAYTTPYVIQNGTDMKYYFWKKHIQKIQEKVFSESKHSAEVRRIWALQVNEPWNLSKAKRRKQNINFLLIKRSDILCSEW